MISQIQTSDEYQLSMKIERDLKNTLDYAESNAFENGMEAGMKKAYTKLIESGMSVEEAKRLVGL